MIARGEDSKIVPLLREGADVNFRFVFWYISNPASTPFRCYRIDSNASLISIRLFVIPFIAFILMVRMRLVSTESCRDDLAKDRSLLHYAVGALRTDVHLPVIQTLLVCFFGCG